MTKPENLDINPVKAGCSCPAGKSGYCNHVMALLFELTDYSLNQLKAIPEALCMIFLSSPTRRITSYKSTKACT